MEFEFKKVKRDGKEQSLEMRVHTVPWFVQGGYWVGIRKRRWT
jgi:hypothetical protein